MSLPERLKGEFTTLSLVLMPIAIAINIVGGIFIVALKLPIYLDSIGTVLVGILVGPWAAAVTGALANIIWGLIMDPVAMPFAITSFFIGLTAGFLAKKGYFQTFGKSMISGFCIGLVGAIVSTPIVVYLFGGVTSSGSTFITAYLLATGKQLFFSVFSSSMLSDLADKLITAGIAFYIARNLPERIRSRFSQSTGA
ncbi:MAG: ECF transporter S component [Firmicutes bacterium]|nr:ECF transporter S component [Bacillota bacterium]